MKKLLLLLTITLLFISCSTTKKIYYQEDAFYPQNSEYNTDWVGYWLNEGSVYFRFIKRSNDKIYIQGRVIYKQVFSVGSTDTIDLKFTDRSVISLDYDGYISQPYYNDFSEFYMVTELKEIKEWKQLELARVETSLGYENHKIELDSTSAEILSNFYTRLKNNEYDEIKSKD